MLLHLSPSPTSCLEPARETGDRLQVLDHQWACQQTLLRHSLHQMLEVWSLAMVVEGGCVRIPWIYINADLEASPNLR